MSIVNLNALKSNECCLYWTGQSVSSNSPKTISSFGDCKQLLPFPGAGIGMFDGNGDYLKITNLTGVSYTANQDYTFEGWFYFTNITNTQTLFQLTNDDGTQRLSLSWSGSSQNRFALMHQSVTQYYNYYSFTAVLFTWYHITAVRNSGVCTVYVNGVSLGTWSDSHFGTTATKMLVGITYDESNTLFFGYVSEVRFSQGVARYTANFTPPRRQLESDSNTKLLLHFNRNDTTFIDSSPSNHTITAYGDTKQLCSPCGSGVAYFDGNGDYLTTPNHVDFIFGTGSFTLECWILLTASITGEASIIAKHNADYPSWLLKINNNRLKVWDNGEYQSTTSISLNAWHHVAFTRSGTTANIWLDGTSVLTYTSTTSFVNTHPIYIGAQQNTTDTQFKGYISDLRISNVARVITVPTQPFIPDQYTKLLLHMDGLGNAFYDSSDRPGDHGFPILPDGVSVTPNGTFTSIKGKDGRNYLKFDGSTNYVSLSDHDAWNFSNQNFTISFWVNHVAIGDNTVYWHQGVDQTNRVGMAIYSGYVYFYVVSGGSIIAEYRYYHSFTAGTWIHISVVRSGSAFMFYVNGGIVSITTSTAIGSSILPNIPQPLNIGHLFDGTTHRYTNANIKDLMIFKKALSVDQIGALMDETFIY